MANVLARSARQVAAVWSGHSLSGASFAQEAAAVRAQIQDVVYGTLRRYAWAEAILARLCSRPPADFPVRALLAVALYRLATRPALAHTVVDQAVEAVSALSGRDLRGLVNGVLRNYLRRRAVLDADVERQSAVRYGLPEWWLGRLQAAWPAAWEAVAGTSLQRPPMCLRVNPLKTTPTDYRETLVAAGIDVRRCDGWAIWLAVPVPVEKLPGFFDGYCSVQDAGAQAAAVLLAPKPGHRVLDACAAPGGKTTHLLELGATDLIALESDPVRAGRITENLNRLGLTATVRIGDAGDSDSWWDGVAFDRILADVPCSASGVVRRHPDAKWLRRDDDVAGFVRQQRRILDALWPLLAPGGRLLYATCSVFPDENGAQISAFCATHPEACRLPLEPAQRLPDAEQDGFFYALLEKRA